MLIRYKMNIESSELLLVNFTCKFTLNLFPYTLILKQDYEPNSIIYFFLQSFVYPIAFIFKHKSRENAEVRRGISGCQIIPNLK